MKQKTIKKAVSSRGTGIHSGKNAELTVRPAPPDSGVKFRRVDLSGKPVIEARISSLVNVERGVTLRSGEAEVKTVEHLMAALSALKICNLEVEIDSEELPAFDGSSIKYVELLMEAGIEEQKKEAEVLKIEKPVWIGEERKAIAALPCPVFRARYFISFPKSFVGDQYFEYDESMDFKSEIAPARTFGFAEEVEELRKRGLALGGSPGNAVVIGEDKYLTALRFKDELVRHKVLDLLGDLALLGKKIQGEIIAFQAGHKLHLDLAKKIKEE